VTLVRPVHHLPRGRVVYVQAVLADHVTLSVGLGRERHGALRTAKRFLT